MTETWTQLARRYSGQRQRRMENRLAWAAAATPTKQPTTPKSQRPKCGATTRKGTPCKAPAVSGSNRCRLHGGLSTGPRTDAGREVIRTSNRRRAILADLVELVPAMAEDRRRQWAAAILALTSNDADHAAKVNRQDLDRWRADPGFCEAERRAVDRRDRCWRRAQRRKAREAEEGMYTMPIESTCIDLDTLPEFDLEAAGANLPDLEALELDFEIPPVEDLDLDALLADAGEWVRNLETPDLEKLLEDLGDPLEGLPESPTLEELLGDVPAPDVESFRRR